MLIILACITGVVLGLSFNILILLPVTIAGALAYGFFSPEQSVGSILAGCVFLAASMQAGYMIGLTSRDLAAQLRGKFGILKSKRV